MRPRVLTFPRSETMTDPNPLLVICCGLFSQRCRCAKDRPVTLAISLTMLVESPTVSLLPIMEGIQWMTLRDHLLFGKMFQAVILIELKGTVIPWISSVPLLPEVKRLVSKPRLSFLFLSTAINLRPCGSMRALSTSRMLSY